MSKTFDKVWHDGLLFKLKQNGIDGKLLNHLKNYLNHRKQQILLNGTESECGLIESGYSNDLYLYPCSFEFI